jgi:hypothetical protein
MKPNPLGDLLVFLALAVPLGFVAWLMFKVLFMGVTP